MSVSAQCSQSIAAWMSWDPLMFFPELVLARAEMQDGRPLQLSAQQPELSTLSPDSGEERTHL